MDSSLPFQARDNSSVKPSFRKPSNDTANRKYRRHSPVDGSASSSSGGSPNRIHNNSPIVSRRDRESLKMSDDRHKKKDERRDLDRDSSRSRAGKDGDSYRHSDRQSYGLSHDYRRHEDYSKRYRHTEEDDRSYQRLSSSSARESRRGAHSDHSRHESDYNTSSENWRNAEKYSRDRPDDRGHKSSDKERETMGMERDRYRDRGGRDDKKDHRRNFGSYKNDHTSYEESKGHAKDSTSGGSNGSNRLKDTHKSSNKELDGQKEEKRKHEDMERDHFKDRYSKEPDDRSKHDSRTSSSYRENDRRNDQGQDKIIPVNVDQDSSAKKTKFHIEKATGLSEDGQLLSKSSKFIADEKPSSSSKLVQETVAKVVGPIHSSTGVTEAANDPNAAKFAAMRAAELVNRNLTGGGLLSTDQKKKLLWGNKKNTSAEESGGRWGAPLFSDRERQEKFNKLMSLRLPWYLWPFVGRERGSKSREQTWGGPQQPRSREAESATTGLGEAIHCWAPSKRWADSWIRPVVITSTPFAMFLQQYLITVSSTKLWKSHAFSVPFVLSLVISEFDEKYAAAFESTVLPHPFFMVTIQVFINQLSLITEGKLGLDPTSWESLLIGS